MKALWTVLHHRTLKINLFDVFVVAGAAVNVAVVVVFTGYWLLN